jgi:phage tail sheath protein FI
MIALNTARKETAFVILDAPFRLKTPSEVSNWISNSANATTNGEDGLVTSNTYSAVYYPSALSTDLAGNNVVVPASHVALRTIASSDNAAFQWFAPAGYQRGLVSNASSVGYIDPATGEYNSVVLSEGSRDTLYSKKVNPIAFMPNRGLTVFGQKTLHSTASALDRVNVARLICYLRYQFDQLAKPFLFELNDRMTRDQVSDTFERFLADLASKRALYDFLVVCDESNNTATRIDANQMWIDIAIQPAKAAEFIYIPIRIKNTGENMSYN